jgi:glycosyltransferase involved in cell wall biosynthesis
VETPAEASPEDTALRVLVCTQGFPRSADDHHAVFIADHAAALAAAGARVTVLCPSAPGLAATEARGDVMVHRFRYAPRRWETLAYTGAMHRRARGLAGLLLAPFLLGYLVAATRDAKDADVVHAHWWLPSGLVAVIAGRLAGVPVVVHVHGTDAALARGPLRPLARWVLRRADAVEVVSTELAQWCRDVAGVDARVARMPLSNTHGRPPSDAPVDGPVLAVGRLVPEKGFDLAIEAVARTGDVLEIVGDGDQRAALEALARDTGASVRFLGSLPPEAVAERYAAARLVVVPSRREGFGMVAAEAAAAGRAVVASAVGGLPDIVGATNGVLVPAGDVEALADALRSTDPALGRGGPAAVAGLGLRAVGPAALDEYAGLVAAHDRRPLLRPLVRWGAALFAAIIVVVCTRSIIRAFRNAQSLDLVWKPGPLALSAAGALVAGLVLSGAWVALVRADDSSVPWRAGVRVWWLGQFGRYLPTGLGSLPMRLALARRSGIAARPALVATAAETVALPLACAVLWLATVAWPFGALAAVISSAVGIVLLRATARVSWSLAVGYLVLIVGQVTMRAVAFGLLFALTGTSTPGFVTLVSAVSAAYLLGLLAVFAPGGIGVREVLLASALAPTTGAAAATAAAVAWRLVETIVELALMALTHRAAPRGVSPSPMQTVAG